MPKAINLVNDFHRRITKSLNAVYRNAPKRADYHERLLYKLLSRAVSYFKLHWDTLQPHERKAVNAIRRYLLSYKLLLHSQTRQLATSSSSSTPSITPPLWRFATIVDVYHGVMVTLGQMGERSGITGFFKQFIHGRDRGLVYETFHVITQTVTAAQLSAMRERERVEQPSQVRLQQAAVHLEKERQALQATTERYVERESQYVTYEQGWVDDVVRKQLSQPSSSSSTSSNNTPQHHELPQDGTPDSDPEVMSLRDYTQVFNTTENSSGSQHHRFFSVPPKQPLSGTIPRTHLRPTRISQAV